MKAYKLILHAVKLRPLQEGKNEDFKVLENKVLRGIFGLKREEVAGNWRRLRSEELHDLYASRYIIREIKSRRMGLVGHVAHMGEMRNAYRISVGKAEGKGTLGRPGR
jgi:hypothetical protein